VTPARSLLIAMVALALLAGTRPIAGIEQFPRGLLAAEPREGSCTIETRPVNFGTYDPMSPAGTFATGEVIFTCHRDRYGRLLRVRVDLSQGRAGSFDRHLTSDSEALLYNLYLDPDARTIWGDGSHGTETFLQPLPPNDTRIVVPVYGKIFGLQDVAGGNYSDLLQATIIF